MINQQISYKIMKSRDTAKDALFVINTGRTDVIKGISKELLGKCKELTEKFKDNNRGLGVSRILLSMILTYMSPPDI